MKFTKEEAKMFLRKVYKTATIEITDNTEKEHLLTLFALLDPIDESNNQHSFCETYDIGGQIYDVTSFDDGMPDIRRHCTWEEIGL